jgi:hypothetical protein
MLEQNYILVKPRSETYPRSHQHAFLSMHALLLFPLSLGYAQVIRAQSLARATETQSPNHIPTGSDLELAEWHPKAHARKAVLPKAETVHSSGTDPPPDSPPTFSRHAPRSLRPKAPLGQRTDPLHRLIAAPHPPAARRPAPHRLRPPARLPTALGANDDDRKDQYKKDEDGTSEERMRARLEEIVKISTRYRDVEDRIYGRITAKALRQKKLHCARLTVALTGLCTVCCLLALGVTGNDPGSTGLGLGGAVVNAGLAWHSADVMRESKELLREVERYRGFVREDEGRGDGGVERRGLGGGGEDERSGLAVVWSAEMT